MADKPLSEVLSRASQGETLGNASREGRSGRFWATFIAAHTVWYCNTVRRYGVQLLRLELYHHCTGYLAALPGTANSSVESGEHNPLAHNQYHRPKRKVRTVHTPQHWKCYLLHSCGRPSPKRRFRPAKGRTSIATYAYGEHRGTMACLA